MKKISLLLALCLMLSIFSGCSGTPEESTGPDTSTTGSSDSSDSTTETPRTETDPPAPVVIDYTLDLPEDFTTAVVEENYVLYCAPYAVRDESTISVEITPRDEAILKTDADSFEQSLRDRLDGEDDSPSAYRFYNLQLTEVDGWAALYTEYSLTYTSGASRYLRYEVVTTESNYVFTFIDASDDNLWLDSYADAAASIRLVLDSEHLEANGEGLTEYVLDCGLTIQAEAGMKEYAPEGFTACLGNHNVIILFMADDKQDNNLTGMTLEEYAQLLCQTNQLDAFESDAYGNLLTTFYSSDENDLEYYNMICVKDLGDAFWVCQMTCLSEDQAAYARTFSQWAATIA